MERTRILTMVTLATALSITSTIAADFSRPIAGLTLDEQAEFLAGREAFEEVETADDGLGPVFNGTSCGACHDVGGTGGGSEITETRFGTYANRTFDPLAAHGGSLIQTDGIGAARHRSGVCAS